MHVSGRVGIIVVFRRIILGAFPSRGCGQADGEGTRVCEDIGVLCIECGGIECRVDGHSIQVWLISMRAGRYQIHSEIIRSVGSANVGRSWRDEFLEEVIANVRKTIDDGWIDVVDVEIGIQ